MSVPFLTLRLQYGTWYGDTKWLESIQRRWTKQVCGFEELSYAERLERLNLYSVQGRRLRQDLIYCYKIFHDLSVIKPSDIFTLSPAIGTRGHRFKVQVQHVQLEVRRKFFSSRVVLKWNSLPEEVVEAQSLSAFKSGIHSFLHDDLFDYIDWNHP